MTSCLVSNRRFSVLARRFAEFLDFGFRIEWTKATTVHLSVLLVFFVSGLFFYCSVRKFDIYGLKYASLNVTVKNNSSSSENYEISYFLDPYEVEKSYMSTEFSLIFDSAVHRNDINPFTVNEALHTLEAAANNKLRGNVDKAAKLYEHALSLQPKHPHVLIEYGLYIETVKSDLLTASSLYTKALILSPNDIHAKEHFSRTLPLVEEIDSKMLGSLDQKRERFLHIPRGSLALRRLMRESYVEHIYHTVALEGNTMNLGQTRSILETHMAISGKSVMEHNEILGLDAALRFINRSLIHKNEPLTVHDVLQIHKRVFGYVDPVEAGQFRRTQVYVGGFVPSMPDNIEQEMHDFVVWLALESTRSIHPVELAALVHYKFVIIHPFIDGNGRTARILMNLFLMKAGFPPVIVRLEERATYYEKLKMANDGDLRPFIRFVASCTERTLDTFLKFTTEISPKFTNDDGRRISNFSDPEDSLQVAQD